MAAVEYLIYDGSRLMKVLCMKCKATIAAVNPKTEKLVHWTNSRSWAVTLEDGSYQNMLVCADCYLKCSDLDFKQFDETRRWGWRQEFVRKGVEAKAAERMVDDFCKAKKIVGRLEK